MRSIWVIQKINFERVTFFADTVTTSEACEVITGLTESKAVKTNPS